MQLKTIDYSTPFSPDDAISIKRKMGTKNQPEAMFKKTKVIPFLQTLDEGYIKDNAYKKGFYSAKKGVPDISFIHHGQAYEIETKVPKGILSAYQKHEQAKIIKAGGIVFNVFPENFEAFKQTMMQRCAV